MRPAELLFLAFLVLYQGFLLVPRHRRLFAANYVIFLAGMALAWNLGLEGFRWQTFPALALLLVDVVILMVTFRTLRGRIRTGWVSWLTGSFRLLFAFAGFVIALGCAVLAVAFPLPSVDWTGGLQPSHRLVRFAPEGGRPGLQIRLWYPAAGDLRPQPRPDSQPDSWARVAQKTGLAGFWQSYRERLPSGNIRGGRLAAPKTKYPVVYVALPPGQDAVEFGYLFEDLASRGFVVAAPQPLPEPLSPTPFQWETVTNDLVRPWKDLSLWTQPEADEADPNLRVNTEWLLPGRDALRQLAAEPGDPLFAGLDWSRQALWLWGNATDMTDVELDSLDVRCLIGTGGPVPLSRLAPGELWIQPTPAREVVGQGRWILAVEGLQRADLSDAAYLKPYLVFWGLKSRPDAGNHGLFRQYQAAFLQSSFWNSGTGARFGENVPPVPGMTLIGR